jgi:predicted metal-dependent peptidase
MVRCGDRDPRIWNYACDIRINNDLSNAGYSFYGTQPWLDHAYDQPVRAAEEDIYDALMNQGYDFISKLKKVLGDAWKGISNGNQGDDVGDMIPNDDKEDIAKAIGNVVQAAHQARLSGHAGDIPGEIQTLLKEFLSPVVPWEVLLHKFFHDLCEEDYSWRRPNRRFQDIYLPSRTEDDGKLDHLIYYLDVSGSVTDSQVIRFNSEVKYIKDNFKPRKLTLVQFDTHISDEKTFLEEDDFVELVVVGRGRTMWGCVREHIDEHKPTAAIVFTDMGFFDKVDEPKHKTPTIFVDVSNSKCPAPYGEIIHIKG